LRPFRDARPLPHGPTPSLADPYNRAPSPIVSPRIADVRPELIAAVLGVTAVWLTVKQNAWCWPIGLVMVLIYGWLFYEVKLYSGMLLQVAYAILQLYGWWQWKRPEHAEEARQVSRLQRPALFTGLAAGCC
jgi:nicotinamide riboside transporter PnuC